MFHKLLISIYLHLYLSIQTADYQTVLIAIRHILCNPPARKHFISVNRSTNLKALITIDGLALVVMRWSQQLCFVHWDR